MIIRNIFVYNTSQKKFEISDIEIRDGKFYQIGNIDSTNEYEVEGSGKYILPGLIDIHMHIESSMTTPSEFSNTVLPLGTTTIVADCHEVANALGYDGLLEYMDSTEDLDIYYAIPSSVPSTSSELETTGGKITENEVSKLCEHPKIRALGEIMNFDHITSDGDNLTKKIIETFRRKLPHFPIEGHVPLVSGEELAKYKIAGIGSDHTHQSVESLIEKTRAGFQIQLQEKSMTKEIFEAIEKFHLEESICFVTDDVLPDDLVNKGHMNHLIKKAVGLGYPIEKAIYSATKTPANRMLMFDRGEIAPGNIADAVILSNLENFEIFDVMKNGKFVSTLEKSKSPIFGEKYMSSIKRKLTSKKDYEVVSDGDKNLVRVIKRNSTSTFTEEIEVEVPVKDNVLMWKEAGLNLICVLERYGGDSEIAIGFVEGGFDKPCAIASSWAHDSHNILVLGNDEALISEAVNEVINNQGGMSIISSEREFISLPFGGVVSTESMDSLATKVSKIRNIMKESGYKSHNEIMSFSVLALLCTPHLKISDKGYVRVRTGEILPWRIK